MTAVTNGQQSSALEHYADTHPNATPDLSFKILRQNNDVLRLHIKEALYIQTLSPPLNRRQEHLGTGFLPQHSGVCYSFFLSFFLSSTSMNTLSPCSRVTMHIYLRYKYKHMHEYTRIQATIPYTMHPLALLFFPSPVADRRQVFRKSHTFKCIPKKNKIIYRTLCGGCESGLYVL